MLGIVIEVSMMHPQNLNMINHNYLRILVAFVLLPFFSLKLLADDIKIKCPDGSFHSIQSDSLDLSFKKYQLISDIIKENKKSSKDTRTLTLNLDKEITLNLVESSILSPEFVVERLDDSGSYIDKLDIAIPYEGYVNQDPGSKVRISLQGSEAVSYTHLTLPTTPYV